MLKTEENIKKEFAGKSQSNQKYRYYAKNARKEGFPNIARLFRITSEAEKIQAESSLSALNNRHDTIQNLKSAIAGKINKYRTYYPEMSRQAELDNHPAQSMFEKSIKLEQGQLRLYKLAYRSLKEGKDILQNEFYLCPRCGNIETAMPKIKCKICNCRNDKFVKI